MHQTSVGRRLKALAETLRIRVLPLFVSHSPSSDPTNRTWRECCTQRVDVCLNFVHCVDVGNYSTNIGRDILIDAAGAVPHYVSQLSDCARDSAAHSLGIASWLQYLIAACRNFKFADHARSAKPVFYHDVPGAMDMDDGSERALNIPLFKACIPEATRPQGGKHKKHANDCLAFDARKVFYSIEEFRDERLNLAKADASDSSVHVKRLKISNKVNPGIKSITSPVAITELRDEDCYIQECKDKDDDATGSLSGSSRNERTLDFTQNTSIKEGNEETIRDAIDHIGEFGTAANCSMCPSFKDFGIPNGIMSEEDMDKLSPHDWSSNAPLKFSKQQLEVLEAVACGKSVFITGSAGTGKTCLLKYIISKLKKAMGANSVLVTASTGIAACALNGVTLHAFSGIGLGLSTANFMVLRVLKRKDLVKRWREIAVLIIDEISMIDGTLFDKVEFVARKVRDSKESFGGIQLIVTGDFFQLPPVKPQDLQKHFAFQADCWSRCFHMQVELEHVFRQSDSVFVKLLNEIRKGVYTSETLQKLDMCRRALPDDGTGIAPTRLFPLKREARTVNLQELKALETSIMTFLAVDSKKGSEQMFLTEKQLKLCVGAQVILTRNLVIEDGLVNGAKGVVMGFQSQFDKFDVLSGSDRAVKDMSHLISPSGYWPVVRFRCGTRIIGPSRDLFLDSAGKTCSRIQVPLILAWALSVHKCQGMTLSKVQTNLSNAFNYGMVYVVLSRVKDLDGLELISYDPGSIKAHPSVVAFSNKMFGKSCV